MDDALRPAPDASYEAQLARPPMEQADALTAERMIGRPLRGESAVAVRCAWGLPAVLRVSPRLEDGTPFPTLFWLACPLASKHVGRLEASGVMAGLQGRLSEDEELARRYAAAAERYVAARDELGGGLPRDAAAGGMPDRVKCLHALYGHHLATRDNPVGAWVADQVEPMPCPGPCVELPDPAELSTTQTAQTAQEDRDDTGRRSGRGDELGSPADRRARAAVVDARAAHADHSTGGGCRPYRPSR